MKKNLNFFKKSPSAFRRSTQLSQLMMLVASLVALPLAGCGSSDKDIDNKDTSNTAPALIAKAPTISVQPTSITVTELQPASFSVAVTSSAPVTYQWKRNGVPITGATSATLAITSALAADHNAKYSAVVTNSAGSVTSTDAVLTQELPMFLMAGQSNMEGNVDEPLFQSLLADLVSGASAESIKTTMAERLTVWNQAPDRRYGYSPQMVALEASELIRLKAAGLVGANLTTPIPKIFCSWNESAIIPLTATPADTSRRCSNTAGPEIVFGHALNKSGYSTTSLIKVAYGGTSLYQDWRSPSMDTPIPKEPKDLYAKLRSRIKSLGSAPTSVNPSCNIRTCKWSAFIWFQGENDVFIKEAGLTYEQNLKNFIADVRRDVGSPTLPVVIVQIGSWAQSIQTGGKNVANAQTKVVNEDNYSRIVNTADLSGFYHYDPAAQLIIGERVSLAVKSLLDAAPAPK